MLLRRVSLFRDCVAKLKLITLDLVTIEKFALDYPLALELALQLVSSS